MSTHVIALGILLVAANSSTAAEPTAGAAPVTRAQQKQSVLKAQAAGQLRVGEAPGYPNDPPRTTGKPIKRKHKGAVPTTSDSAPAAGARS